MPTGIDPRLARTDQELERIILASQRYDAVRTLYQRLRDNPLLRDHPNFDMLLHELARIGVSARDEIENSTFEWLDASFIDIDGKLR